VFAQRWYALPSIDLAADGVDWTLLVSSREAVKKTLEELRAVGTIGSGLNAVVTLYAEPNLAAALGTPGDELRFWFITSGARLSPLAAKPAEAREHTLSSGENLWVYAEASPYPKCERCWHQVADVGTDAAHPGLCGRCHTNIDGAGEIRRVI